MAGTKEGAAKAKATILARDPDFYKRVGAIGGRNGNTGGFAANPELARIAGRKGGSVSRRGKAKPAELKITTAQAIRELDNYYLPKKSRLSTIFTDIRRSLKARSK